MGWFIAGLLVLLRTSALLLDLPLRRDARVGRWGDPGCAYRAGWPHGSQRECGGTVARPRVLGSGPSGQAIRLGRCDPSG